MKNNNKHFQQNIYSKFIKGIKKYNLIETEDKLAVCISGGKDSLVLAECIKLYKQYSEMDIEIVYIMMDPGFSENKLKEINENISRLNIDLNIYSNHLFETIDFNMRKNPCFICSKIRRGYLYSKALELGCNKLVLGHHFNDVIETTLLNLFYNGYYGGMLPKIKSKNFDNIELIRPLYLVEEEDIIKWCTYQEFKLLEQGCKLFEEKNDRKRTMIKRIIKDLKKDNPSIDMNIFNSLENVNLEMINGTINEVDI